MNGSVPTNEPETQVRLVEINLPANVQLSVGVIDSSGRFTAAGTAVEITSIDPRIDILTTINHNGPCYRKISFIIPESAVTQGPIPLTTYDLGTIDLAGTFAGESISCI